MFISRSSSFSVVHVNVDIEIKSKERIVFVVVVFISKRPGSYAIYRRNARLLEMQHLIPAYMKGWTVRADVPRGCNRLPNFLTQGAPPRARAPPSLFAVVTNNMLQPCQSGSRFLLSTVTAFLYLTNQWCFNIDKGMIIKVELYF